jgi:hypothetical protein
MYDSILSHLMMWLLITLPASSYFISHHIHFTPNFNYNATTKNNLCAHGERALGSVVYLSWCGVTEQEEIRPRSSGFREMGNSAEAIAQREASQRNAGERWEWKMLGIPLYWDGGLRAPVTQFSRRESPWWVDTWKNCVPTLVQPTG